MRMGELVRQIQPLHGVLGIQHRAIVFRRDLGGGETIGERCAADQEGDINTSRAQILGRHHHLLGGFYQQSGEPNIVGLFVPIHLDEPFWRHFDPQVDDLKAIVAQDDVDQVFADVVHITFHRGQDDFAFHGGLRFFHVRFEVANWRLHSFSAQQHLGHDEFVVVEQAADFIHTVHERPVDDLHWLVAC